MVCVCDIQVCLHNEICHIVVIFITLHHPGRRVSARAEVRAHCKGISLKANLDIQALAEHVVCLKRLKTSHSGVLIHYIDVPCYFLTQMLQILY